MRKDKNITAKKKLGNHFSMDKSWEEQGQEKYLSGIGFKKQNYPISKDTSKHDHCEFCWKKFSNYNSEDLCKGFVSKNGYHWICPKCFEYYRDKYKLILLE